MFKEDSDFSNEKSEDEDTDYDDIRHTPYLLSAVRSIEQMRDLYPPNTFSEGFKLALLRFNFDSPSRQDLYTSTARLLLATKVPRGTVIDIGSILNPTSYFDNNHDPPDILLVKEWDSLRLRSYERQVAYEKYKWEMEKELDDDGAD